LPFEALAQQEATQESDLPASPDSVSGSPRVPIKVKAKWSSARATVEIWSGDDSGVADMLARCLAENRIRFRCQGASPTKQHFFVCPEESAHAAEIVAAITESASLA
jgi:hypothetical protein